MIRLHSVAAAAAGLATASAAWCQAPVPATGTSAADNQVITVLGSRDSAASLSNVPVSITRVQRDEIQLQQLTAERIEDILSRTVPGFNPTNVGVRLIRGRTAQVFVNGVPANEQLNAGNGSDINLLAPDQLQTIEVARGANAAYGFGSPGGIVALSTPRAESTTLTLKSRLGTSFNTSQASGSYQTSLYQSAARIVGDFDYHVGVSLRRDGLSFDPDARPALDFNSPAMSSMGKEDVVSVDSSLGWKLGAASALRLTTTAGLVDVREHYESDGSGSYRDTPSRLVHLAHGDRNRRRHATVNLSYEHRDLAGSALRVEWLASRVRERRHDSPTEVQRTRNDYTGMRSSITTPVPSLAAGATLTYGVDLMRNRFVNPLIDETTGRTVRFWGPGATLDSTSPYVQMQWPIGRVRVNAGVRHERYEGRIDTGVSSSGRGDTVGGDIRPFRLTLFNAGAVLPLAENREAYASYTQGAEVSQLSRAARSAGSAALLDPQPAKSDQVEVGVRQRGSALGWSLAAFHTASDLMSALLCNIPNEPCKPLREPRRYWGVEGALAVRLSEALRAGGTFAWMDSRRTLDNGERRRVGSDESPPPLVAAYLDHQSRSGWRTRLQIDYRGERKPFGTSTDWPEGAVDSLLLAHLSTSIAVGPGTLSAGVRNLFDKRHHSIVAQAYNGGYLWIPEQGRRIAVSYAADW